MDKILRNVIMFVAAIFVVIIVVVALKFSPIGNVGLSSSTSSTSKSAINAVSNSPNIASGEIQNIKLSVVGGTYILTPNVLKKDVPVRMEVDLSSVKGCARDVVIKDFNVRKYVKDGDTIISFTPTKIGTINIACSMNMYRGSFTVEDATVNSKATVNNQVLQVVTSPVSDTAKTELSETKDVIPTHTCGGSGGSCGCGASTGGCGCGG
jgi:hypothetical protein